MLETSRSVTTRRRRATTRHDASRCVAMQHRRDVSRRDNATMCPDASPRVATRHDASRRVAGRGHLESQRVAMRHDVSRCLTTHCDALRRAHSRQDASGCVTVRHRARSCVRFDASHRVVTRRRAGSCTRRRGTRRDRARAAFASWCLRVTVHHDVSRRDAVTTCPDAPPIRCDTS